MKEPNDWMFMPETIGGLQPLGSFTRQGDEAWTRLVKWVHLRHAGGRGAGHHQGQRGNEMGKAPTDPDVRRYFGLEGDFGKLLGVDNGWSARIVKDIGNYGEVYEASFGAKGPGPAARDEQPVRQGRPADAADLALTPGGLPLERRAI